MVVASVSNSTRCTLNNSATEVKGRLSLPNLFLVFLSTLALCVLSFVLESMFCFIVSTDKNTHNK